MAAASRSESEDSTHPPPRKNNKAEATTDDADSGEEGADDEEEYEIEEVLDAKRGYFPDGRMGYFVKWKGYPSSENSWVDENDAANAKDLVEEFWAKNPHKKRITGRKSLDKQDKPTPKKARKSVAVDDSSDAAEKTTKKRGRKSVSQKVGSGDDMDVDQPEKRSPKKARKSAAQTSKATKRRSESPEERPKAIGNMKMYMHLDDWEGLVKAVDTVENVSGKLVVYFTLRSGEAVMEATELCRERFPQKLFDFYEKNLRWRAADEEEA